MMIVAVRTENEKYTPIVVFSENSYLLEWIERETPDEAKEEAMQWVQEQRG